MADHIVNAHKVADAIAYVDVEEYVGHQQRQQGLVHADGTHAAHHDADKEVEHQECCVGM